MIDASTDVAMEAKAEREVDLAEMMEVGTVVAWQGAAERLAVAKVVGAPVRKRCSLCTSSTCSAPIAALRMDCTNSRTKKVPRAELAEIAVGQRAAVDMMAAEQVVVMRVVVVVDGGSGVLWWRL